MANCRATSNKGRIDHETTLIDRVQCVMPGIYHLT